MKISWHGIAVTAVLAVTDASYGQLSAGWGVDACLSRHVPAAEVGGYLRLLDNSTVAILRERDVGHLNRETDVVTLVRKLFAPEALYENDPRPAFQLFKSSGKTVLAFAGMPDGIKPKQVDDALPEDLLVVFAQGEILARDFSGLVDAWEMVGEPDVGNCTDLPDRVVAYQKALYLGIKSGAAKSEAARNTWHVHSQDRASTSNVRLPSARGPLVLMGALALPPGPWLERAVRNGLLDYTDAYNFHLYGHAEDLSGIIAAHDRISEQALPSGLPLWITECGINTVPDDDFLNPERRQLQADFTVRAAEQALASSHVAVFMPFILVHNKDPHALTLSADKPLAAWEAYARFTKEHPWPKRALSNPPSSPNPIVLQWMPDNTTTEAQKVSGSYRFRGNGPIRSELRVYNLSDRPIRGQLVTDRLTRFKEDISGSQDFVVQSMSVKRIPVIFSQGASAGYGQEGWSATFVEPSGRRSMVAIALETRPEENVASFDEIPLHPASVGTAGSRYHFDPGDEIVCRGKIWQGINLLQLEELPDEGVRSRLRVWTDRLRRDPLRAVLAVAKIDGLPSAGFLRLQLDRSMGPEFVMCVDLVDRSGQRFTIWENAGVSYFHPKATDVWLNLADFTPYFWGRCLKDPKLHPENIEELQLRFYISKASDPREISLSFMIPRT